MNERLHHIDCLKGFAMILVVTGHIIVFCGLGHDNVYIKNIVMINMPLFLFLNGLVVKKLPIGDDCEYLLKKFRQVVVPFLSWGVLITLYRHESYTHFLFHYWKFGYWYLLVLFEFYVIYAVFSTVARLIWNRVNGASLKNVCMVVIFILGYFCVRYAVRFLPDSVISITSYFQIVEYYPYFFLGVVFRLVDMQVHLKRHIGTIMTVVLVAIPVLYNLWSVFDNTWTLMMLRILTIMMMFMVAQIYFSRIDNPVGKILDTIGKHTLTIYMIQFFLFSMFNFQDLYELLDRTGNGMVIMTLSFAFSILLCYMCMFGERLIQTSPLLSSLFLGKRLK